MNTHRSKTGVALALCLRLVLCFGAPHFVRDAAADPPRPPGGPPADSPIPSGWGRASDGTRLGFTLVGAVESATGTGRGMRRVVVSFKMNGLQVRAAAGRRAVFDMMPVGGVPGHPALPAQVVTILLPATADLRTVRVSIAAPVEEALPDLWDVAPAPPYGISGGQIVWPAGRRMAAGRDLDVFAADADYPASPLGPVRSGQWRQRKLLSVTLFPYRYNPVTRKLRGLRSAELLVDFETGDAPPAWRTAGPGAMKTEDAILEGAIDAGAAAEEPAPPAAADGAAVTNYVIITTSSIQSQSTKLADFIAAKTAMGFTVHVVTEGAAADASHYVSGASCDQRANNIRNWLQTYAAGMGIEYVLLVGDPHPTSFASADSIPMKMCYPRRGQGSYEESPTDMYFADLTGNWDNNANGYYGEYADVGSGGVDLLCEVAVGRMPVYDTGSTQIGYLDSILTKTIAYEAASDRAWRTNCLGSASFQDDGFTCDGAEMIEEFRNNVCTPNGVGTLRLYQQGSRHASCDSVYASDYELRGSAYGGDVNHHHYHWQTKDYGIVMWWGHGSSSSTQVGPNVAPDGTLFSAALAAGLDNAHPSFLFPNSCLNGYPEDAANLCVSVLRNGGIGVLSPSRVTWYAVSTWQTYFFQYASDNASCNYYAASRMIANQEPVGDSMTWVHANGGIIWWQGTSLMNHFDFNTYGDPSVGLCTGDATLTVISDYGMASPPAGNHVYPAGTVLTCTVTNSPVTISDAQSMTRAACTGWTRTGSAPASGATTNTGSFTLQTASTVTWHWVITELALSNQVVSSAASHAARDSLRALDNYIIEPAGVVDFSVGSTGTAILGPGFQAQPGSTLTVRPGAAF